VTLGRHTGRADLAHPAADAMRSAPRSREHAGESDLDAAELEEVAEDGTGEAGARLRAEVPPPAADAPAQPRSGVRS
jgi:hypothetical protein